MKLEGLGAVTAAIRRLEKRYYDGKPPVVIVGYTQKYALYVHERPAKHNTGKWKYLTDPARRLNNDGTLKRLIVDAVKAGKKLNLALLRAGMRIQRDSQNEVPVDTSALKASAFTAYEQEVGGKARAAFNRGEGIRAQRAFGALTGKGKKKK